MILYTRLLNKAVAISAVAMPVIDAYALWAA